MYGKTRYIVIGLVVILVILLGILLLRGGSKSDTTTDTTTKTTQTPKKISDYNTPGSMVRLTIDGPVNADQSHRMVRITIAQNQANLDIYGGYQYTVLASSAYSSNKDAYNDFLYALQNGGFDRERHTKDANYAGMCPLGQRYIFEVFDNEQRTMERWAASCPSMGTFGGRTSLMLTLFKAQIPDYTKQVNAVDVQL